MWESIIPNTLGHIWEHTLKRDHINVKNVGKPSGLSHSLWELILGNRNLKNVENPLVFPNTPKTYENSHWRETQWM